ncbi:hypothetical protein [Lysobacter gummosus]|uniref:hypothetical protein n=1 Tax=Lysobacter gummosus TaxID=262324 RepID=UPI0036445E0F
MSRHGSRRSWVGYEAKVKCQAWLRVERGGNIRRVPAGAETRRKLRCQRPGRIGRRLNYRRDQPCAAAPAQAH